MTNAGPLTRQEYVDRRRRLMVALHAATQTVKNAQAVRDRAEADLDAFLDEHGHVLPPDVIGDPEVVGEATIRFIDEHPLGGTSDKFSDPQSQDD